MDYTGVERFKCGCTLYLKEMETEEVVVKIELCKDHKEEEEKELRNKELYGENETHTIKL